MSIFKQIYSNFPHGKCTKPVETVLLWGSFYSCHLSSQTAAHHTEAAGLQLITRNVSSHRSNPGTWREHRVCPDGDVCRGPAARGEYERWLMSSLLPGACKKRRAGCSLVPTLPMMPCCLQFSFSSNPFTFLPDEIAISTGLNSLQMHIKTSTQNTVEFNIPAVWKAAGSKPDFWSNNVLLEWHLRAALLQLKLRPESCLRYTCHFLKTFPTWCVSKIHSKYKLKATIKTNCFYLRDKQ